MSTPRFPPPPPPPRAVASPPESPFTRREMEKTRRFLLGLLAFLLSVGIGFAMVRFPPLFFAGGLLALVCGVVVILRPFVGLLVYAVLFLVRPAEVFPILNALHLERVVGVITLAGIFLAMIRRYGAPALDSTRQTRWLLLFTGSILLSIPFSYWIGHAVSTFVEMLKILGFYIMIAHLVDTRKKLRIFLWLYVILIAYVGVGALRGYYAGKLLFAQGIDRAVGATSAGGGENELGTTMASVLPLFIVLLLVDRRLWRKFLALAGIGIAAWCMVFTGSRASLLGCLAGLTYLWWISKHRVLVGVAGVLLLVTAFALMPAEYQGRYGTITSGQLDGSSMSRLVVWMTGLHMFIDRPIFGVGAGCFGTAHAMAYSVGRKNWLESHSLYIQVIAELGLVGAICFFTMLAQFLKLNRQTARLVARLGRDWRWESAVLAALFAGFLVLIVSGVFGHSLYRRTWYIYAALGLAVYRIYRAQAPPEPAPAEAVPPGALPEPAP